MCLMKMIGLSNLQKAYNAEEGCAPQACGRDKWSTQQTLPAPQYLLNTLPFKTAVYVILLQGNRFLQPQLPPPNSGWTNTFFFL